MAPFESQQGRSTVDIQDFPRESVSKGCPEDFVTLREIDLGRRVILGFTNQGAVGADFDHVRGIGLDPSVAGKGV